MLILVGFQLSVRGYQPFCVSLRWSLTRYYGGIMTLVGETKMINTAILIVNIPHCKYCKLPQGQHESYVNVDCFTVSTAVLLWNPVVQERGRSRILWPW